MNESIRISARSGAAAVLAIGLAVLSAPAATGGEDAGAAAAAARPRRPVHTYSIVARDPATGELGVAVQSHWFSVGPLVPWAEAGVGAVATQSFVEVSYGPLGLELMRAGRSAAQALGSLLATDDNAAVRQVAMIDAAGRVAAHTGDKCIDAAGHRTGDNFSVQANLMRNDTVWGAMAAAFESTPGPLAERMLAALAAAEAEGGDIRGRQSAAHGSSNQRAPWPQTHRGPRFRTSPPSTDQMDSNPAVQPGTDSNSSESSSLASTSVKVAGMDTGVSEWRAS